MKTLKRHRVWHWILLGGPLTDIPGWAYVTHAYVMDDFGNAVPITYRVSCISLRAGEA